jgi:hypothetical protein
MFTLKKSSADNNGINARIGPTGICVYQLAHSLLHPPTPVRSSQAIFPGDGL